jgi:hypothetical protein
MLEVHQSSTTLPQRYITCMSSHTASHSIQDATRYMKRSSRCKYLHLLLLQLATHPFPQVAFEVILEVCLQVFSINLPRQAPLPHSYTEPSPVDNTSVCCAPAPLYEGSCPACRPGQCCCAVQRLACEVHAVCSAKMSRSVDKHICVCTLHWRAKNLVL